MDPKKPRHAVQPAVSDLGHVPRTLVTAPEQVVHPDQLSMYPFVPGGWGRSRERDQDSHKGGMGAGGCGFVKRGVLYSFDLHPLPVVDIYYTVREAANKQASRCSSGGKKHRYCRFQILHFGLLQTSTFLFLSYQCFGRGPIQPSLVVPYPYPG